MSVRRKKRGLVISWQKSFSILAPWGKGKGDREAVLEREVVLTKMKLFSNFPRKVLTADDSPSTINTGSISGQNLPDKVSKESSDPEDKPEKPGAELDSDYLSSIFSDSELPRLYKFESEDSGVELPSGANSPSTTTGSEQSLVAHSRESSCDSGNLNPDTQTLPHKLASIAQNCEIIQEKDLVDLNVADTQDSVFPASSGLSFLAGTMELHIREDIGRSIAPQTQPEGGEQVPEELRQTSVAPDRMSSEAARPFGHHAGETRHDMIGMDSGLQARGQSATSDGLEEYMDECCRLSEAQQANANPLTSGLDYLQHICQLIEKMGRLQEANLRLQRQICGLQRNGRVTKTKEDFFQQHCSCGAASLAFQEVLRSRSDALSASGTQSDLSTIPEVRCRPPGPRRAMHGGCLTPTPLWKRRLNRRSYPEGGVGILLDHMDTSPPPQCKLSESYTWGRVKELVSRAKWRKQCRLGLNSSALKMSCPQLYRPDLGPVEPGSPNRNSMISLGFHSKQEFSWLH